MTVGFTGTRQGMTPAQHQRVRELLAGWPSNMDRAHHGMCLGSDEQFHHLATDLAYRTIGHPGVDNNWAPKDRAPVVCDHVEPEDYFLTRNRHIVNQVDVMIATPAQTTNVARGSGTWATIRYARKMHRWLIIIWPDGTQSENRP